jgi:cellulase/cellobiase CelA1
MLTKPDLNSEEMNSHRNHPFLPIWKGLYRQWDLVKASYDRAHRGTVYVSLPGEDGYFTRLSLKFGKLSIIFVMFNSGKPAGWVTRVGDVIIDDQRMTWTDEQRSWFDPD